MATPFPSGRSTPARLVLREEGLYRSDREPVPYNLTVQPAARTASEQIAAETHDSIRAANARAEKELEKIRAEQEDYLRRRYQNEGDAEARRLALLRQSAKEEEDHRKNMEHEASRRRTRLLLEQALSLLAY